MTATLAQTITRTAATIRTAITDGTIHRVDNWSEILDAARNTVRDAARDAGVSTTDALYDFWTEVEAPAVYVPQVGDVVVFHGDKAGHVSGSDGVGPYPVRSDDTRDEPYTMFWLHAHEMTPVFG